MSEAYVKQGSTGRPKIKATAKVHDGELLCGICGAPLWGTVRYNRKGLAYFTMRLARGYVERYDPELQMRVWQLTPYAREKLKRRGKPGLRRQFGHDQRFSPPESFLLHQPPAVKCHHCRKTQCLPEHVALAGLENP